MITFEVDELTSCLKDSITGEIMETEVIELKRKSLLSKFHSRNGWYVNWGQFRKGVRIFALVLKGTFDIQGMVAIERDDESDALHIAWACTAPQNNKKKPPFGEQKYIGVGGHLLAIAAEMSDKLGYEGFMYGEPMDEELFHYYIDEFGAVPLAREIGRLSVGFTPTATKKIREVYNYVWSDEES